jgi:Uma2 family endonuclease
MSLVARRHHRHSYQDYLALEEDSNVKHEYLDGEIYAMAGGTLEHARLGAEVIIELGIQLRGGPCKIGTSDLRVRALATGKTTYPDVTVICGEPALDPEDRKGHTLLNPSLLVEVTSHSTEEYDRGDKFDLHYRRIPSLREYVIVSHRERSIEVRVRQPDGQWSVTTAGPGQRISLPSLGAVVDVDALYDAALGAGRPPSD